MDRLFEKVGSDDLMVGKDKILTTGNHRLRRQYSPSILLLFLFCNIFEIGVHTSHIPSTLTKSAAYMYGACGIAVGSPTAW